MTVPKQVQAASDRADEIINAAAAAAGGGDNNPVDGQDMNQNKPEYTDTVDSLKEDLRVLNAKLKVLQGKYDAEIKALDDPQLLNTLKAENRRLSRQVNDFSKIISDFQDKEATRKTGDEKNKDVVELTDEELDHLRDEGLEGKTLDIIKKMINSGRSDDTRYGEIAGKVESLEKKISGDSSNMSDGQKLLRDLTVAVPNWREINGSADNPNNIFLDWLDGPVPYSGKTKAEVLHDAQASNDTQTCIDIFLDFAKEHPDAGKKPGKKTDDTLKVNPENLIEPPNAGSGDDTPGESGKPTYSMAEYEKHYSERTKGLWRGREKEWDKKTTLLDKAFTEGRIK
jgi:hypothetical protein